MCVAEVNKVHVIKMITNYLVGKFVLFVGEKQCQI